jgi:tellurite resistance protein TerC
VKIIWNFLLHKELKLVPYLEPHWSLLMTVTLLGGSMLWSLWATREKPGPSEPADKPAPQAGG